MTINLIPPKLKQEKDNRKIVNFVFSTLFILFIFFSIISVALYFASIYSDKDIKNIEAKIDETDRSLNKMSGIKKQVEEVNAKLIKVDNLNQNRIVWSNIATDLAKSTPTELEVKTLSANSTSKKISLTGIASSRREIARFKEKLESSKYFQNVIFTSSSYNSDADDYSFSITCELEETK